MEFFSLFFTMLPFYIFGNIHCMGMCGPLVMMLGQHQYRTFYFFGRILSFSLAGLFAGGLGSILHVVLKKYHISALTCFLFGMVILMISFYSLIGKQYPGSHWISKKLAPLNQKLSLFLLKDQMWPTFFFGFFTLFLPCGQSLIVFSACALAGNPWVGMFNGFAFALLTSPSLWFAMRLNAFFSPLKKHFNTMMGALGIVIAFQGFLRGLAEIDIIPHLILNANSASYYHIVIY